MIRTKEGWLESRGTLYNVYRNGNGFRVDVSKDGGKTWKDGGECTVFFTARLLREEREANK